MNKTLLRALKSVAAVTAVSLAAGATSTLAGFTAATKNPNQFDSGTLVLSNQKDVATACLSTGAGTSTATNDNNCDALFDLDVVGPGDNGFVDLTLKNEGSLSATGFSVFASDVCTPRDTPTETYDGGGDLCPILNMYIQEYPDAGARTADTRADGTCWFGGGTPGDCAFDPANDLASFDAYTSGAPLTITDGLAAGASRFFRIYLEFDAVASDNTHQGRGADFDFTWQITY